VSAAGGHLVWERDGALWAVPGGLVEGLERGAGGLRVRVVGGVVVADRVLALTPDLAVRPAPLALSRLWPQPVAGIAVFERRPVVVVDPTRPPHALVETLEVEHGDDGGEGPGGR